MRRAERVRSASEYATVRAAGHVTGVAALSVRWATTTRPFSRFGIVAGKQVGNAVIRNRVKRRLRAILRERHARIASGFDIVITARSGADQLAFDRLAHDTEQVLRRARLWLPVAPTQTVPSSPVENSGL